MASEEVIKVPIKKITAISTLLPLGIALVTSFTMAYGFYNDTVRTQKEHTDKILEQQNQIDDLSKKTNDTEVFKGRLDEQMKSQQAELKDVKDRIRVMDSKLDKIILQTRD